MARESARRRERRAGSGVRQLPFAKLQNPFRQVEILSADQIEAIHRASLRLLENVGFEVLHDESLDIFQRAGAKVDRGSKRVQLDGAQVEELVAKAPPRFSLRARNRDHDVTIGEGHLIFIATGGPAFASDLDRSTAATSDDHCGVRGHVPVAIDASEDLPSGNVVQRLEIDVRKDSTWPS